MKLKLFILSAFLALAFVAPAQGPLSPWAIKGLQKKSVTNTVISGSYFPVWYSNQAYQLDLATVKTNIRNAAVDSVNDAYPYLVWTGLISQSSTSAPSSTAVLKNNTGGTISWSRTSAGLYVGELSVNTILAAKAWTVITSNVDGSQVYCTRLSDSTFNIKTVIRSLVNGADSAVDAKLSSTPFELRIYK